MINPLEDAREAVRESDRLQQWESMGKEVRHLRTAMRALIQHGEEIERRVERAEGRLAEIEEQDRPPSGLQPTMGAEQ